MKLDLFLLADYANVTGDGKLNVMGVFSQIFATNFPARHPSMYLVIRLLGELGEYGEKRSLTVRLVDEGGQPVGNISGEVQVPQPQGGRPSEINAILHLRDTIFPKPGPYQFVVLIDKDHKGSLTLHLAKIEPQPDAGG